VTLKQDVFTGKYKPLITSLVVSECLTNTSSRFSIGNNFVYSFSTYKAPYKMITRTIIKCNEVVLKPFIISPVYDQISLRCVVLLL